MRKQATTQTELICSECGSKMPIVRKKSKQKELLHIKHLYCYQCREITQHIELKNVSLIEKDLEFNTYLTDSEQEVYNLIQKSKQKVLK